ncbi:MAG: GSCFA domain-containing protein [Muribaculaceae bacterium]|nr:GSCFA domain-containing protein [Muribaculaceae bacterium]
MKFRTELDISKFRTSFRLNPQHSIIGIGSCFASNITCKMQEHLWDAINPFGTLYNPLSIALAIRTALNDNRQSAAESVFESNRLYHTWLGDSSFSSRSVAEVVAKINNACDLFIERMEKSPNIIITFGTARCYFMASSPDKVVANCHKMPASIFLYRRISVSEIVEVWSDLLLDLKNRYPDLNIILTVSPVRHLKDGFHENSISKSILLLAIEALCSKFTFCHYFPAYELIMDDLRDYRFYASDLTHPSSDAINYIWEKFQDCYLDPEGVKRIKEGGALHRALAHRSILESPEEYQQRVARIKSEIDKFTNAQHTR